MACSPTSHKTELAARVARNTKPMPAGLGIWEFPESQGTYCSYKHTYKKDAQPIETAKWEQY